MFKSSHNSSVEKKLSPKNGGDLYVEMSLNSTSDSSSIFPPRRCCNPVRYVKKRLPILEWLPKYNFDAAISDFIAGITVGLTAIPQGIAYALVANLPAQYGLYSAFMGCFMYCLFGSSKDITVGPTAIMALLTSEHANKGAEYMILLTFLTGLIILTMGILKLGFVIDFISVPVTAGFTSAAAITIASGQIGGIFGLEMVKKSHVEGITGTWIDIIENFDTLRVSDTILGITCTVILLAMKVLNNITWFDPVEESRPATRCQTFWRRILPSGGRKFLSKFVWIFATARNAVVVITCGCIAYGFDPILPSDEKSRNTTFILTGNIDAGLPPFQPPPFSVNDTATGVVTNFKGMISELGSAIAIIPLLGVLENVAIAKAFAKGKPVDANQEMFALGICNLFGSFVRSMPTTGSFSRTAVNSASGVKTQFGGVYCGALVLLALGFMMPFCAYIPKATLAAVIITAVIFSIEYEVIRPMWRSKKLDLIPAFATFFGCLFWALEYGILVGVGVQILFVLYNIARPRVKVYMRKVNNIPYLLVVPDRALVFPSIGYVRSVINKAGINQGQSRWPVVLDCSHISSADFTAAKGFKAMISDFRRRGQPIIFYNTCTSVADTFLGVNHEEFVIIYSEEELYQHITTICSEDEVAESTPPESDQSDGGGAVGPATNPTQREDRKSPPRDLNFNT